MFRESNMAAEVSDVFYWRPGENDIDKVRNMLLYLKETGLTMGLTEDETKSLIRCKLNNLEDKKSKNRFASIAVTSNIIYFSIVVIIFTILIQRDVLRTRCAVENNYVIMEITRPVTDCSICEGVKSFRILENVTKDVFAEYAYLGQPLLVKGATENWTSLHTFSFDFFKQLYSETKGAYQSVEEECQFFPFRTEFLNLEDVFKMPDERARMSTPEAETWYIGWSNCNPDISTVLRQHYSRPYFLPDDSELSAIDWIFMGYSGQGASMHLDYVQRPSWQAQISGTKTWYLQPSPECEDFCHSMNITVHKGDIILIDTNQWYHTTYIQEGGMSITIGSEYD